MAPGFMQNIVGVNLLLLFLILVSCVILVSSSYIGLYIIKKQDENYQKVNNNLSKEHIKYAT